MHTPRNHHGVRGGLKRADRGIRKVASTFGKPAFLTHGAKSSGLLAVEGESERLVSNILCLDPRVRSYRPQPLTVDVMNACVLLTREEKKLARARHKECSSEPVFYTPDFFIQWALGTKAAVEVKTELYVTDAEYEAKLSGARDVLWSHGLEFMRVVIPSYWRHPLLMNVPLLYQASVRTDLQPDCEVLSRVQSLADAGARTLGEFCGGLGMDMRMAAVLIVFGALGIDIVREELKSSTPAVPAHGSLDHLCILEELAQ